MSTRFSLPPDARARMQMLAELLDRSKKTQQKKSNHHIRHTDQLPSKCESLQAKAG